MAVLLFLYVLWVNASNIESNTWDHVRFPAHKIGVNSVSWAPAAAPASLISTTTPKAAAQRRIVSGGCDKLVTIWGFNEAENKWEVQHQLSEHGDWVRDVAWAPSIGLPTSTIASCSQDGTVIIWTQEEPNSPWVSKVYNTILFSSPRGACYSTAMIQILIFLLGTATP